MPCQRRAGLVVQKLNGLARRTDCHQERIELAGRRKKRSPTVDAHQRVRPKRDDDHHVQQRLFRLKRTADQIAKRIGQNQADGSGDGRDQDGLSIDLEILGVQHGLEVIERKAIDHVVVLVGRAKAHDQDVEQRHRDKREQPQGDGAHGNQRRQRVGAETAVALDTGRLDVVLGGGNGRGHGCGIGHSCRP